MDIELEPENWLTYRGDHRESVGSLMGPTTLGQICTVIAATYHPDANKSRLGLMTGDVRGELPLGAAGWDAGAA